MLFKVYDANGECFEVTPVKARSLVIESGWSLEPPKQAEFVLTSPEPVAVAVVKGKPAPTDRSE
jgi:hypothetical protein